MGLVVVGSIALDSVITPFGETADTLGGAAVFFAMAGAVLHPVQVVGVVGSDFPETDRDVDETDLLQAYGELYFKDTLGADRPLRFQFGRMSFDYVGRKLIGRNRWRNTTNSFEGFRLQLGQQSSDWQLNFLAVHSTCSLHRAADRRNGFSD